MKTLIEELREEQAKFNPNELVGEIGYLAFEVAIRLANRHQQQSKSVGLADVIERSEQCILHSTDLSGKCFKCGEDLQVNPTENAEGL